ncbi:MAG: MBL fold metallo-hydrolase [Anaerohalosphaera sp.]|nr:MBL fold metallo-hydrolase [Anaerohalosphaera sp.]
MNIHNLVLGEFETNSFVLTADDQAKDCLIIDTGLDAGPLLDYLRDNQLNPVAVIFTHGHVDHIRGIEPLRKTYPHIKALVHAEDKKMFTNAVKNLSVLANGVFKCDPPDDLIEQESVLEFAGITLQVIHTPGHTKGGISLYSKQDNVLFAGDTLFACSIGRTDLPGGNFDQLIESIKTKLLILPDNTTVYTGHGPATTIDMEKRHNQYLR